MIRLALAAALLLALTAPAHAVCRDTPANRAACKDDVWRMCSSEAYRGGIPAAVICLQRHRGNLSPDCSRALALCETPARLYRN